MTKIIVDSNIIFSTLLNINSRIGQILINGKKNYDFYAPKYVRTEILEHQEKIKKIAKLNNDDFFEVYELILRNIIILNHSILPIENFNKATELCKDIDVDDTLFVAFSEYLKADLWTGDKKLLSGLTKKGYRKTITTEKLYQDFRKKNKL
ncbi:putative nucleic acid-binding protein [Gillisia sp. Hel_I_86]|uniref:PIN domain-containing protein n=1 Tax=Gillisia sp. Hel_I_86 TaxID=1249981 RepID=UPI00119933AA|nr:PIN domain-containing protein [Gillisia sp. Hel_I_86]TVZ26560.1 putative nucleic acid-binding protein [Gillisia sp. Hel_I_86]